MSLRHEVKIEINNADLIILRSRIAAVASPDTNAENGLYFIRSLYFDTPDDRALHEKLDGVNEREKFRIRFYNFNTDFIRLEKKSKKNGLSNKESAVITKEQAELIIGGDTAKLSDCSQPLVNELCLKMKTTLLRPRTVVDYRREAFVYAPGNVRITFDSDIRTGVYNTSLFDRELVTVPVPGRPMLLEVKWDGFLPDVIRSAVFIDNRRAAALSKYAQSRLYG